VEVPGNRGLPLNNSPKIQPTDQRSTPSKNERGGEEREEEERRRRRRRKRERDGFLK
jgi:hypothetical protein